MPVNSYSGRSVNHLTRGRWQVWSHSGHCSSYSNTHTVLFSLTQQKKQQLPPPSYSPPFIPSFSPSGWPDPCHVAWLTAPSVRKRRDGWKGWNSSRQDQAQWRSYLTVGSYLSDQQTLLTDGFSRITDRLSIYPVILPSIHLFMIMVTDGFANMGVQTRLTTLAN